MRSNKMMVALLIVMGLTGLAGLVEVGGLSGCCPLCIRNSDCGSGQSCLAGGICGIGDAGISVDFSQAPDLATTPPDLSILDSSPNG